MSHHFDTKLAKEDPGLNVCDLYLFEGSLGTTVMIMTVNPDVGLSAPDTLHAEGLYTFRFDLNADAREELAFKFRFGEPRHAEGKQRACAQQKFQVLKAKIRLAVSQVKLKKLAANQACERLRESQQTWCPREDSNLHDRKATSS
jgi:hypothetical protein